MMQWVIRNGSNGEYIPSIKFDNRWDADFHIDQMGAAFTNIYESVPDTDDQKIFRMLTEGMVAGDLRYILLPQLSIDEYVPGDPETNNIVFAFFIKGVSSAVIPFRDFVMKCRGVLDVAYGDSDTIPDTSIVYVEMQREKFQFDDLQDMMEQVTLLSNLRIEDFSIVFPTTTRKVPYSEEVITDYFIHRSITQNQKAQQDAIDSASSGQETTGADQDDTNRASTDESLTEWIISKLS